MTVGGQALTRDCSAIMIPSGERITLSKGLRVYVEQALGGAYTLSTETGYLVRVDGVDGDAIGQEKIISGHPTDQSRTVEARVWEQLESCYDPEIPVSIVDLGLIYMCELTPLPTPEPTYKVDVRMTLTAPGCGMGPVLVSDVETRLRQIPEVKELDVELVFDPPWSQDRMTDAAKLQLNFY